MRGSLAVVALLLAAIAPATDARADEDWASHLRVTAVKNAGAVKIVAEGGDGWSINTAFPMKITLTGADKTELGKADARFEDEHDGKAKRAVFEVKAAGPIEGAYKFVVCTKEACSPPIKGKFVSR